VSGWPVPVCPSSHGEQSIFLADVEDEEYNHSELPDLAQVFGGPLFEEELCDGLFTYLLTKSKSPIPQEKKMGGQREQQQKQRDI